MSQVLEFGTEPVIELRRVVIGWQSPSVTDIGASLASVWTTGDDALFSGPSILDQATAERARALSEVDRLPLPAQPRIIDG